MEHIELAGIHSGDSACVIPPISIPPKHIETISEYTRKIAMELNVVGLMNIQYAIYENTVYVLEANPRASRTVPIVSKVCNISMARLATQVMLGKRCADLGLTHRHIPHFGVKEAVFPFQHVSGSRSGAGTGNALHRRGARAVALLRPGVFQGPGGHPGHPAPGGDRAVHRSPTGTRPPPWSRSGSSAIWGSAS